MIMGMQQRVSLFKVVHQGRLRPLVIIAIDEMWKNAYPPFR